MKVKNIDPIKDCKDAQVRMAIKFLEDSIIITQELLVTLEARIACVLTPKDDESEKGSIEEPNRVALAIDIDLMQKTVRQSNDKLQSMLDRLEL